MMDNWYGASLLTLADCNIARIGHLLTLALRLKREGAARPQRLKGRSVALLFEKPSTRTRCAFAAALAEEGAAAVDLATDKLHLGGGRETWEDTARLLGRMFDAVAIRCLSHRSAATLDAYSGAIPVYNALSDTHHPTQALADLMTLSEIGRARASAGANPDNASPPGNVHDLHPLQALASVKLAYIGDARNNVANSLRIACRQTGVELRIGSPKALWPADIDKSGGWVEERLLMSEDPRVAVTGVDALYTDVWASMGEDNQYEERRVLLEDYRVDAALMEQAGSHAFFLHCLPAIRGDEVSADIIDGPQSLVWEQAENRKHTIKALLLATLSASAA